MCVCPPGRKWEATTDLAASAPLLVHTHSDHDDDDNWPSCSAALSIIKDDTRNTAFDKSQNVANSNMHICTFAHVAYPKLFAQI